MLQPIGEEVDAAAAPNLLALEINLEIVGGNVLINGRSSLQKQPKASKVSLIFSTPLNQTPLRLSGTNLSFRDEIKRRQRERISRRGDSKFALKPQKKYIKRSRRLFYIPREMRVTRRGRIQPLVASYRLYKEIRSLRE